MLVVVKKPLTEKPVFEIRGDVPNSVIEFLRERYVVDVETSNKYVDISETDWYKEARASRKPGDAIRVYRDNFGYSQTKLGELLGGISRHRVSDMENNRRGISKSMAKSLSRIFKVPVSRFI